MKILGMRDYFRRELERKLCTKFGNGDYSEVMEQLTEWGYLNDDRATRQYIISKLRASYGEYYIKSKLYERGIDINVSDVIDVAYQEDIDMEQHIRHLASRYIEDNFEDNYKQYGKCMSYLNKRGYTLSLCMNIIKREDFER